MMSRSAQHAGDRVAAVRNEWLRRIEASTGRRDYQQLSLWLIQIGLPRI